MSPIASSFGRCARRPDSITRRSAIVPSGGVPKTIASGCGLICSTSSMIGTVVPTPGTALTLRSTDSGRKEAGGASTPGWETAKSESPRWTSPPAVFFRPWPSESRATIVATPSAMPSAVNAVRPGRRPRFASRIEVTPWVLSHAGPLASRLGGRWQRERRGRAVDRRLVDRERGAGLVGGQLHRRCARLVVGRRLGQERQRDPCLRDGDRLLRGHVVPPLGVRARQQHADDQWRGYGPVVAVEVEADQPSAAEQ